jgi:hypothetical protein
MPLAEAQRRISSYEFVEWMARAYLQAEEQKAEEEKQRRGR